MTPSERDAVWNRSLQQHLQELFGGSPEDIVIVPIAFGQTMHTDAHARGITEMDRLILKPLKIKAD